MGRKERERWWRRRLEAQRKPLVYVWRALALQHGDSVHTGLALWAVALGLVLYVSLKWACLAVARAS